MAISKLCDAYKWSPGEFGNYTHIYALWRASVLTSVVLQSSIIQNIVPRSNKWAFGMLVEECQQLRALSELQWRAYQTGPQHGACLSFLQSQLSNLTIATAREAIKLVREV